jgi:hypothetical protein
VTVQLFGEDQFESTIRDSRSPAKRAAAKGLWILLTVARCILSEIVDIVRQDLANGRIVRTREDWER